MQPRPPAREPGRELGDRVARAREPRQIAGQRAQLRFDEQQRLAAPNVVLGDHFDLPAMAPRSLGLAAKRMREPATVHDDEGLVLDERRQRGDPVERALAAAPRILDRLDVDRDRTAADPQHERHVARGQQALGDGSAADRRARARARGRPPARTGRR